MPNKVHDYKILRNAAMRLILFILPKTLRTNRLYISFEKTDMSTFNIKPCNNTGSTVGRRGVNRERLFSHLHGRGLVMKTTRWPVSPLHVIGTVPHLGSL